MSEHQACPSRHRTRPPQDAERGERRFNYNLRARTERRQGTRSGSAPRGRAYSQRRKAARDARRRFGTTTIRQTRP